MIDTRNVLHLMDNRGVVRHHSAAEIDSIPPVPWWVDREMVYPEWEYRDFDKPYAIPCAVSVVPLVVLGPVAFIAVTKGTFFFGLFFLLLFLATVSGPVLFQRWRMNKSKKLYAITTRNGDRHIFETSSWAKGSKARARMICVDTPKGVVI